MLALRYRIALLIEASLLAALGVALVHAAEWTIAAAIVVCGAIPLALRMALIATQFGYGWRHRSPRAPLGIGRSAVLILREWLAFLRFNLLDVPFDAWRLRSDPQPRPLSHPAVILLHGYYANRGCFRRLVARLEADGIGPIFTPNLRSFDANIERYAAELEPVIERIAAATGQRVVLVAHSMGGLAARAYLARNGDEHVAKLITIASPHHGTALAAIGWGEEAGQMRIGSAFLRALEEAERTRPRSIPALALYTPHDNMVMPQETARLDGAPSEAVPGEGHLTILDSRVTIARLREALG